MRLKVLAAVSLLAVTVAGCTNETLDNVGVDVRKVSNKTQYQLSGQVVSKMASLNIDRHSPVTLRIFKEEGILEIWKADRSNRFQMMKSYQICAWSGKLGPKVKEGDRQAPEGFYPLGPQHMNPNSQYYLAINTGFPNNYDRANARSGSNLMIHGACSSSGCYSMTDEQMVEIFAFARDAFKGGQKTIQLQAYPFRMTAENMARHRDNPNIEFWKMLKVGYDHFQVTKRPPEVGVCAQKYVFNQQAPDGKAFSGAAAQCPTISTPSQLQVAMNGYEKTYAAAYAKAMKKYEGTVWLEPSEAQRKAIVADKRKGRELAYAPTGNSIDAGKLMSLREIEAEKKRTEEAAQRKIEMAEKARQEEEARKTAELQKLADDVAAQKAAQQQAAEGGVAVPAANPGVASVQAEQQADRKPFWKLWSSKGDAAAETPAPTASTTADATPPTQPAPAPAAAAGTDEGSTASIGTQRERRQAAPAQAEANAAADEQATQAEPAPAAAADASAGQKQPFWKFWKKQ
ncbi:murein L,D-transpeptidase [Rhizobium sp. TRM96647]|uniref:murein L,D-transpeptidase n=1 Tax=unclassified Rhizobium TaxID=2613769 RepID=UPI0021E6EE58|nr:MULTISPECIES: murein L,D-transpeptidase [unclassified Rhizobium]MCV3734658.1 murein L,D-transpeptidase [Rhizobium sp. TRM96647]MCV3757028.1 murein L,D-transpeptidase [Rhizobium sp. TRM96650]